MIGVVKQNPHLNEIFENSKMLFEKPLTISQISFEEKLAVENHILMIGDTAGLIHPLCGNGMAMAIHSAKIASELLNNYFQNKITSRSVLESTYQKEWSNHFKNRLKAGRLIARVLQKPKLSEILIRILVRVPSFMSIIIKKTHGKPLNLQTA